MNLVTFIKNQLKNIDVNYTKKCEFFSELSLDVNPKNDNVVLSMLQGLQYSQASSTPIMIEIYSENIKTARDVWLQLVKNTSDRTFIEGEASYYFTLSTPIVSQRFLDDGNTLVNAITIYGTVIEMLGVVTIAKVELDDEELEPTQWFVTMTNGVDTAKDGARTINESEVLSTALKIRLTVLLNSNGLFSKLQLMRTGITTPNVSFKVKLFWTDGSEEEHIMKSDNHSIAGAYGTLSNMTLDFIK